MAGCPSVLERQCHKQLSPCPHAQEKWDKDLYIGSVAWGPMVN